MMDLTPVNPILSEQVLAEFPLLETESGTPTTEGGLDFYAIMEELILDNLTPLQSKNEKKAPVNSEIEGEGIAFEQPEAASPSLDANPETTAETVSEELPAIKEPEPLDPNQNIPLLWFGAQSFEPPISTETVTEVVIDQEPEILAASKAETKADALELVHNSEAIDSEEQQQIINPDSKQGSTETFQDIQKSDIQLKSKIDASSEPGDFKKLMLPKSMTLISEDSQISSSDYRLDLLSNEDSAVVSILDATPDQPLTSSLHPLQSTSATSTPASTALMLEQPIDSPAWGDEFNQQIIWLGQQKIDRAVIRLNPQELGPLEVNIHFNQDQATVSFTTHTNQVHDLIEQSIPLLREMMADQGVNLSQVNIESNANQNQQRQQPSSQQGAQSDFTLDMPQEEPVEQSPRVFNTTKGIVDYFA